MTLGDGKEYVIAPLTLGALEDFNDQIQGIGEADTITAARTIVDVASASLQRNYPALTRDHVRHLIDLENMREVFESCMDASGAKRKALEASGEAKAVSAKPRRR